jgi:hypothetical protein
MKKFLLFILTWLLTGASGAQDRFFLYFESGDMSPFYIKMGDKVYSSVTPGYLVLPGLTSGTYSLFIGSPGEQKLESRFSIIVNNRDLGLVVKRSNQKLLLQEVNSSNSIEPMEDPMRKAVSYTVRTDPFSILLSKASGDPGLLMVPVFAAEPAKTEKPVVAAAKPVEVEREIPPPVVYTEPVRDSMFKTGSTEPPLTVETKIIADKVAVVADPVDLVKKIEPVKDPVLVSEPQKAVLKDRGNEEAGSVRITRYAESSAADGFHLVFLEEFAGGTDTIRITIPNPKFNLVQLDNSSEKEGDFLVVEKPVKEQATVARGKEVKEVPVAKKEDRVEVKIEPDGAKPAFPVSANKCRNLATENDFFRIRRNMATRNSDELMVDEAKKVFRSRCFTTEQIRHLSSLFLTSAGKYLFFDAAYIYVSDPVNFEGLQSEIKDEYYLRRFKALIGQ